MIITCPNCNKQFKIDNSLIPDEGRDLECGSCNHVWFHKIEEENNSLLKLEDEIIEKSEKLKSENDEKEIVVKEQSLEINKIDTSLKKKEKNSEKKVDSNKSKNSENKVSVFFSYLIVFIISFIALIVLLDTLKTPLINVFPGLEIILFNLFETLQDIKLFIIDLV